MHYGNQEMRSIRWEDLPNHLQIFLIPLLLLLSSQNRFYIFIILPKVFNEITKMRNYLNFMKHGYLSDPPPFNIQYYPLPTPPPLTCYEKHWSMFTFKTTELLKTIENRKNVFYSWYISNTTPVLNNWQDIGLKKTLNRREENHPWDP